MASNKVVWLAIGLSALVHVGVYTWFAATGVARTAGPGPSGVVSIAFVEPVVHEAAENVAAPTRPNPTRPRRPRPEVTPSRASSTPPSSAATSPASAGPTADEVGQFAVAVGRLIDARKVYPRPALSRELEGRVVVAITLAADGTLVRSEVEEPSPYGVLNDAALGAVRDVARYPALPPTAGASLHLHVPILFKIKH